MLKSWLGKHRGLLLLGIAFLLLVLNFQKNVFDFSGSIE